MTSSSLTGQVSLTHSITLCTHREFNLPFAPADRPVLTNKGTKSLNLLYSHLIPVIALSTVPPPPLAPIVSPR